MKKATEKKPNSQIKKTTSEANIEHCQKMLGWIYQILARIDDESVGKYLEDKDVDANFCLSHIALVRDGLDIVCRILGLKRIESVEFYKE